MNDGTSIASSSIDCGCRSSVRTSLRSGGNDGWTVMCISLSQRAQKRPVLANSGRIQLTKTSDYLHDQRLWRCSNLPRWNPSAYEHVKPSSNPLRKNRETPQGSDRGTSQKL